MRINKHRLSVSIMQSRTRDFGIVISVLLAVHILNDILYHSSLMPVVGAQDFLTERIKLADYRLSFDYETCPKVGKREMLDTAEYKCKNCPGELIGRKDFLDPMGNIMGCECPPGFMEGELDCSDVRVTHLYSL